MPSSSEPVADKHTPSQETPESGKENPGPKHPRFAGVDLGTNSIRLLVAELRPNQQLEPLLRLGESCRLGEGLETHGVIMPEAEERATRTLQNFVRRARSLKPQAIAVAATHALRSASNGSEVAARLSRAVDLPVEVLSGEDEARMVYGAVRHALGPDRLVEPCLVLDIGGGSVELVRGDQNGVTSWVSLDLGCVRLSERFLVGDPPIPEELSRLETHVRSALAQHSEIFEDLKGGAGVGGTLTAMAALNLGLVRYEAGRVEGHVLDPVSIDRWSRQLAALTIQERTHLPAVGPGRADIIVAGCSILKAVLAASQLDQMTVSTRGLRYAVVRRLAEREG